MRTLFRILAASCAVALTAVSCSSSPWPSGTGQGADASTAAVSRIPPLPPRLPGAARMEVIRAQQTAPGYDFAGDGAGGFQGHAGVHGSGVDVASDGAGVRLTTDRTVAPGAVFQLGIATTSVGRSDGSSASRGVLERNADGQELVLTRDHGVEERYLAGPLGVEQSYALQARPGGEGSLVIQVAFDGLTPRLAAGTVDRVELLDAAGKVKTRYSDLVAVDAAGNELTASMQVQGTNVSLVIDDASATYPVRVDPVVWTQQGELTPSDGAAGDWFGASVSLSGNLAIVGAPNHTVGGKSEAGAAYVFALNAGTWTLQQELTAGDAAIDDSFGSSVTISGTVAVVGAPFHAVGANAQQGAAYVFVQNGTTWTQSQELTASDGAAEDQFGNAVSLGGTLAVVGAPLHKVGTKSQAGAAYVFAQNGTFSQQQELTAGDDAAFDLFGFAVAVSGTTAVVGAYQHDVGAVTSAGSAYVFVQSGTTWSQQQELTASDGAISDFFGYSVGVSGGTAVVGAYQHNVATTVSAGAAYVFVQGGTTWSQQQEKLTASDDGTSNYFGAAVGVFGGTAVVGAYQHIVGANADQGSAYTFTQSGTTWTQAQELTSSDGAAGDQFGTAVGGNDDSVIVGALGHAALEGSAYVFLGAATGECYIDGTVYASGAVNPADACQACVPATSTTSFTSTADGTSCGSGEVCHGGACVAGCFISGIFFASGAVNPGNSCQVCTPATSTTSWSDAANGQTCSTGNACFQTQTCQSGTCTGSNPVTCTPLDQCHVAGACNPATGQCSNPTAPDGTTCTGTSLCFTTDACVSGVCTGSNPVTCAPLDQCHVAGTCAPATGQCSNPTAPDGTTCNDGVTCDENDVCTVGVCAGTPYTCTPGVCQATSTCSGNAGCAITNDPSGASCPSDGNPCHLAQCDGTGDCLHPNAPDGTACGTGQVCESGVCGTSSTDAGAGDGSTTTDSGATDGSAAHDGSSDGSSTTDGGSAGDGSTGDGGSHDGSAGDAGAHDGGTSSDGSATTDGATGNDGASADGSSKDGAVGDGAAHDGALLDGAEADSGLEDGAGEAGDGGDGGPGGPTGQSGGCGCKTAGSSGEDRPAALLGIFGLAFAVARRRRRGASK